MYGHVITKFSRMGRLLHFHGAPLTRFERENSAITGFNFITKSLSDNQYLYVASFTTDQIHKYDLQTKE